MLLALVASIGLSFLFYKRKFKDSDWSKKLVLFLFSCRALLIFGVLFLLLNPLIKGSEVHSLDPEVLVLVDNSSSISAVDITKDSLSKIVNRIKKEVPNGTLRFHAFDKVLRDLDSLSLTGGKTNLSGCLEELSNMYEGRNVASLVLLTDGIINEGYVTDLASSLKYPVHAVGIGNPDIEKDASVLKIYHNNNASLGNNVPVKIGGIVKGAIGESMVLKVHINDLLLKEFKVDIVRGSQSFSLDASFTADSIGLCKITATCSTLKGERVLKNNIRSSYVDVKNKKNRILLLTNSAHPDVSAFTNVFREDDNFALTLKSFNEIKKIDSVPEMVLVFGWPDTKKTSELLKRKVLQWKAGVLYLGSNAMDYKLLKGYDHQVVTSNFQFDLAQVAFNDAFDIFGFSKEELNFYKQFPPLTVPHGEYVVLNSYKTLFYQKIGSVPTDFPLISVNRSSDVKKVWCAGEGLWRWPLHEAKLSVDGSTPIFDGFVKKICAFLQKEREEGGLVLTHNRIYKQGDRVVFNLTVLDDAQQANSSSEMTVVLRKDREVQQEYSFEAVGDSYMKDFGLLGPGRYTYFVSSTSGTLKRSRKGVFVVKEYDLEQLSLTANHNLLRKISKTTGGVFVELDKIDELLEEMKDKTYPTVSYFENFSRSIIGYNWILFLLLALACTEWFVRKWNGDV